MTLTADVAERLTGVRQRIVAAGGDPAAITIVAVTKGFGPEAVVAAASCGLDDVGENYAQELVAKAAAVTITPRWHFVGRVQTNKVGRLAALVHRWHGVERAALGPVLARHRPGASVLVQVNVSGEPGKAGCRPQEAAALVASLREHGLDVRGLMTIGAADPVATRAAFRGLARLGRTLRLDELSMGMSEDLEIAVQEGATMVRIGRALFGPRPAVPNLRR
jgi:pyridoxal phosphate enzyme (YggS family)